MHTTIVNDKYNLSMKSYVDRRRATMNLIKTRVGPLSYTLNQLNNSPTFKDTVTVRGAVHSNETKLSFNSLLMSFDSLFEPIILYGAPV